MFDKSNVDRMFSIYPSIKEYRDTSPVLKMCFAFSIPAWCMVLEGNKSGQIMFLLTKA